MEDILKNLKELEILLTPPKNEREERQLKLTQDIIKYLEEK